MTETLEGKILDRRFFLERDLGAGSFGAVYQAQQRIFDIPLRIIGLKLFHGKVVTEQNAPEVLKDAIMLMGLQQESSYREVAPYLVTAIDAGFTHEEPRRAYLVMDYVDGYPTGTGGTIRTLQGLIRAFKPVPVELALHWIKQILKPLAWMHTLSYPVLHCDLKPDNILADGKNRLKVCDFGLAQLVINNIGTSNLAGALSYQAPETLARQIPTTASDVYQLGLILYEILAGENPFTKLGLDALAAERNEEYRQIQFLARKQGLPDLIEYDTLEQRLKDHPVLIDIVEKCLAFEGSKRYYNAADLLQEIELYKHGVSPLDRSLEELIKEVKALLKQKRFTEARSCCEQAKERFPTSGQAYRWLGEIYLAEAKLERGDRKIEKLKEAIKICKEGSKVDANECELYKVIANAYDFLNPTVAISWQQKAVKCKNSRRIK